VFSLGCLAYLLLSGAQPFGKRTAIEARDAKSKPRRPANVSHRQWQALRSALRWERESRPTDVLQWLSGLELGGARKLPPFNDLLEPPAAKESKSWLGAGIAAGVAALLFAFYWLASHRNMLPSIDSSASIRAPANPAPHSPDNTGPLPDASPPPAPIAVPAAHQAPVTIPPPATATSPAAAASRATAAPRVTTAPPVPAPSPSPAAASPAAASPPAASRVAAAPTKAPAGTSKIETATDTVEVLAGQPSAQVSVRRKGNLRGETSFRWWTESGTAKPGADFTAVVPQLAYFADGKSNVSLSIPLSIAPHAQAKSFYVVIDQSEDGAALGARTLTMVTLLPSD
jgi:hypothetical protein